MGRRIDVLADRLEFYYLLGPRICGRVVTGPRGIRVTIR